jgi:hypothetical protein
MIIQQVSVDREINKSMRETERANSKNSAVRVLQYKNEIRSDAPRCISDRFLILLRAESYDELI